MKVNIFSILIVVGIFVFSCEGVKEKTAEELLENSEMKEKIYAEILLDTTYFMEFMNKIALDDRGKIMMARNSSIVKAMCMSDKMDSIMISDQQVMENLSNRFVKRMIADSLVCDHTCTRIMENEYLKKYFRERGIGK